MSHAWDAGARWHLEQVTAPDLSTDSLSLAFVRDQHLRSPNENAEDDYIERLIATTYRAAERVTWRAHLQQTWMLVLSRFPVRDIVFPKPPLQSVTSIAYVDEDGVDQELLGSPAGTEFQIVTPSGPKASRGRIVPLYDETWPATRAIPEAVRIQFVCGYPSASEVPADIDHGRLLMIAELYKQRSESVHANNQNPALIRAEALWKEYRAY